MPFFAFTDEQKRCKKGPYKKKVKKWSYTVLKFLDKGNFISKFFRKYEIPDPTSSEITSLNSVVGFETEQKAIVLWICNTGVLQIGSELYMTYFMFMTSGTDLTKTVIIIIFSFQLQFLPMPP